MINKYNESSFQHLEVMPNVMILKKQAKNPNIGKESNSKLSKPKKSSSHLISWCQPKGLTILAFYKLNDLTRLHLGNCFLHHLLEK